MKNKRAQKLDKIFEEFQKKTEIVTITIEKI